MWTERNYQPSLLWALIEAWAKQQRPVSHPHLRVYIYRTDQPGAYYLHGPRLYWDADLGDDSFGTCDQDALWKARETLGEVVVMRLGHLEPTLLLGRTYEEAFQRLTSFEQMQVEAPAA